MKLERLQHLLDAYGADANRWPATERASAEALIAAEPAAARLVADARKLDRELDSFSVAPAPMTLHDAILRRARQAEAPRKLSWRDVLGDFLPVRPLWPNVAGLAAAAVIGIGIGLADLGTTTAGDDGDAQTVASLFGPATLDDAF